MTAGRQRFGGQKQSLISNFCPLTSGSRGGSQDAPCAWSFIDRRVPVGFGRGALRPQ